MKPHNNAQLDLYIDPQCSHCQKVIDFVHHHALAGKVHIHKITDAEQKAQLQIYAHSTQVPCLVVNGKAFMESANILVWLKENLVDHKEEIQH